MTTQFVSQWLVDSPKTPRHSGSKSLKRASTPESGPALKRLVAGSRWLTEQHGLWLNDDAAAADDAQFYYALHGWERLEGQLRDQQGYEDCIFGPGGSCPEAAIVNCAACIGRVEDHAQQLGFAA